MHRICDQVFTDYNAPRHYSEAAKEVDLLINIGKTEVMTPASCKARGVLDFGLDGGVPPGPRDPNPCLEVKKVPMFRDFAQKMDPCLGIS